jgi:hypothetical protein
MLAVTIRHISTLLLTMALFAVPGSQAKSQSLRKAPAALQQDEMQKVLSWLPADTETITVARGPFQLAGRSEVGSQAWDPAGSVSDLQLNRLFEGIPTALFTQNRGFLASRLKDTRVLLAVEGARGFRRPQGLGEGPFDGCEIAILAGDAPETLAAQTYSSALRQESIQGRQVSVFEEKMEEDTWTTFVAFPARNVILVATDRAYLAEVLRRFAGGSGPRALPATLPEWKDVDTAARFWGLRHYDHTHADIDPTSPFGGRKAGNVPDEKAIGITFSFNPGQARTANITYLAGDRSAGKNLLTGAGAPEAKGLNINVSSLPAGTLRATYSLDKQEPLSFFTLQLLAMLGHVVYI